MYFSLVGLVVVVVVGCLVRGVLSATAFIVVDAPSLHWKSYVVSLWNKRHHCMGQALHGS